MRKLEKFKKELAELLEQYNVEIEVLMSDDYYSSPIGFDATELTSGEFIHLTDDNYSVSLETLK